MPCVGRVRTVIPAQSLPSSDGIGGGNLLNDFGLLGLHLRGDYVEFHGAKPHCYRRIKLPVSKLTFSENWMR